MAAAKTVSEETADNCTPITGFVFEKVPWPGLVAMTLFTVTAPQIEIGPLFPKNRPDKFLMR